jgi:hypothetical protein
MKSVSFGTLKDGDKFFDPVSGEDMEKASRNGARFLSGGDYILGTVDYIAEDEMVEIEGGTTLNRDAALVA